MRRAAPGVWSSLLIGLLAAACATAAAPTPVVERGGRPSRDDVNRVARQLYCPICENEPLDVCQTSACTQWRAQIAQYLAEGKSDEEIVQIFVDQFGQRVRGELPFRLETAVLWIGPILFAIAAIGFAFVLIRRLSHRPPVDAPPAPAPAGDEYVDRVERDLQQRL